MRAWKYKQLMPRVLVARLRLIEPKEMLNLLGKDFHEILLALAGSPYGSDLSEIPLHQLSSGTVEKALVQNFTRTCEEIVRNSPRGVAQLVSSILSKFETNNAKAILRAKRAGLGVDEAISYIVPMGRLDDSRCRKTLEDCKSLYEALSSFSDLEFGPALMETWQEYEREGSFLLLETVLDKYVFRKIWEATGRLRGLDGKIARTVLGLELDSANIRAILRYKSIKTDSHPIERYIIPFSEVFGREELKNAIQAEDIRTTIETLMKEAERAIARDYVSTLASILKEYDQTASLLRLETILDRALLEISLRMLKRYTPFFNIGLILAYLNLKWFEVRNLRIILKGSVEGIAPRKTTELLVLPG